MKLPILCPSCGSDDVTDAGFDDGAGDYADSISEMYECLDCGELFSALEHWIDDDETEPL